MRKRFFIFIILILAVPFLVFGNKPKSIIAIQSLGIVGAQIIETAKTGIEAAYDAEVYLLPPKSLPEFAYYRPRGRYRAEKLLDCLESINRGRYTKILGLTEVDISTTKGKIKDWGIFGLGTVSGEACVVSTFRLRQGRPARKLFNERLVKVVNHELGHTFGLNHCPNPGCLMNDAKGTIKTVDRESGSFCSQCKSYLSQVLREE